MNKLITWIKPFAIFGLAIAIPAGWFWLVVSDTFVSDFLGHGMLLIVFIVFWLIMEAAAQADPTLSESPLHKLVGRYSNTRDKRTKIVAIAAGLITGSAFMDSPHGGFSLLAVILAYYGICLVFGTRELRWDVTPAIIKRWINRKSPD